MTPSATHYNYFRDYDPASGRYVESDPIGLDGGLNTYTYSGNSPLYSSDPRGTNALAAFQTGYRIGIPIAAGLAAYTIVKYGTTPGGLIYEWFNDDSTMEMAKPPRVNDPEAEREWREYKDAYDAPQAAQLGPLRKVEMEAYS